MRTSANRESLGPGAGWLNHVGTPNTATDRYPTAPPSQIGTVVSATTFLSTAGPKLGHRIGAKVVLVVCMFLLGALGPGMLAMAVSRNWSVGIAVAASSGLLGSVAILWFLDRRMPACSFIGTDGFARCTGLGRRVATSAHRFAEVADVDVKKINVRLVGARVAIRYEFRFLGANRRPLLTFAANQGRSGPNSETDEAFFGLAAVGAWQRQRASIVSHAGAPAGASPAR